MPVPTPHQVIVAALTHPDPDGVVDVEARARLIESTLIEFGHLPDPSAVPTPEERLAAAEDAAQRLAAASRHPRFTDTGADGWRRLLLPEHDADVGMAYLHAIKHSPQAEHDVLAAAKGLLLDMHHAERLLRAGE